MPTEEQFRALARSSPWRWHTLRFTVSWHADSPVRAWVRRPRRLRVEALNGTLLHVVSEEPATVAVARAEPTSAARPTPRNPATVTLPSADQVTPAVDADGLVLRRPSHLEVDLDDPVYRDYRWVAMLDPAELADGRGEGTSTEDPETAVSIEDLTEVSHGFRPAWEATVRPTSSYDPRCACCPLFLSEASDDREAEAGGLPARDVDLGLVYPEAYRVRLDVGTGVCVLTEAIGGARAGSGHSLLIEAVDEPMADELFG